MQHKRNVWLAQVLCLMAFAAMAMASSSSSNAVKHVDDFVEGYNEGKRMWSEENFRQVPLDSLQLPEFIRDNQESPVTADVTTSVNTKA